MGAALHLHGAVGTRIEGCTFSRLDNDAIILTGYDRNVSIVNNTASWLGMNFAAAWVRQLRHHFSRTSQLCHHATRAM